MDIITLALAKKYADEKLTNINSSFQSDWNQNDEISPDYIKNRPFYSTGEYENKELLKDFKPTALGDGVYILRTCPVLIEGQTYQVILNNEEFICVGRINDEGSVALGNINYKTDGWTDEHEPFSLSSLGGMGILDVDAENASTEYTISISEAIEKIQPLDKKYIADYLVGEKTEGKEFVYKDKTYIGGAGSEIFNSPANKAIGSFSHAEGADTVALGNNSHAEGVSTKALADESHAEGDTSYAEGISSHAEGYFTQTFGEASHSEGIHTIASGDYSHAEGENTVANSQGSHVQGRFNLLDDMPKYTYSYFIGNAQRDGEEKVYILNNTPVLNAEVGTFDAEITETQVKNLKTNDLVIFSNQKPFDIYYNITEIQSDDNSQYQLALTGITTQINRGPGTYAHIVGNGTSEENRSNAHTLDWNGNAWYSGTIKVGGNSYDDGVEVALKTDIANIDSSKYELKEDAQIKYDTIVNAKADWNQNDESELDYIKNKPFGVEGMEEFALGENVQHKSKLMPGTFFSEISHTFDPNLQYKIIINENEYICTPQMSDQGNLYLGSTRNTLELFPNILEMDSSKYNWDNEEYPFSYGNGGFIVKPPYQDTYTISLYQIREKIKTLDAKYIDYIPGQKTAFKTVVHNDAEYICEEGAEIFNDYLSNLAIGQYSHAEGYKTTAIGDYSHAEGYRTIAEKNYAHAEGDGTKASGFFSHAEGTLTEAIGSGSHAEGVITKANASSSHAEGEHTIALGQSQHVQGKYNIEDTPPKYIPTYASYLTPEAVPEVDGDEIVYLIKEEDITFDGENNYYIIKDFTETPYKDLKEGDNYLTTKPTSNNVSLIYHIRNLVSTRIDESTGKTYYKWMYGLKVSSPNSLGMNCKYAHIVGNGTSEEHRSNAHTLNWDGTAWFAGDVYVGSTFGINMDEGSKKLATEDFVNEQVSNVSSIQSDWNQNSESELDYIKNRPFYAGDPELTEVFNGNISFTNHTSFINHFSLLEGETYQVIWNNEEYLCTCQKSTIGANQFLCIGNTSLAETDSTQWIDGEPFLIQDGGFATIVNTSDDNSSCSAIVNIYKEYVKLLDRKFVSYMAGENVEGKTVTYNNQTYTCPTGAEIFNSPTNKAIGLYSHAEGYGTVAYGAWCHAEGTNTYVSGNGSHAEGQSTIVDGFGSHAEGANTKASGDYIHVEGYNTIASSNYQHVQGKHNIEDAEDKYAHIVGNGTESTPSNAHTLDWNGNAEFQGDVKANACGGANPISLVNIDNVTKNIQTQLDNIQTQLNSKPTIQLTIWEEND